VLLEAELRARLDRLSLRARRRVRGVWSGRHASVRRGESLDFVDYRQYQPGDDFRRIDHQLWARLGVVLVRLYEAEEELPLRLVLDVSASMGFGRKAAVARRLAAVMAYLALSGGDRIRLVTVPGPSGPVRMGPWARHVAAWPQVERWLEELRPEGRADLAAAARLLLGSGTTRGPVALVSDLLTEGWQDGVRALGIKGGGVLLHVLSPEELEPDLTGDLTLVDSETGGELHVSTSAEAVETYRQALGRFLGEASHVARQAGLDYVLVPASDQAVENALSALASAQVVA
jgi:uncharacterized protein (DUF58 family)